MEFVLADTFTESLARLLGDDLVTTTRTALQLLMNLDPAHPDRSFQPLPRAKDPNFRWVPVRDDLRIILHQTNDSRMLCYVGRHAEADTWAQRRRLEVHPKIGAAQWVHIRTTAKEALGPFYPLAEAAAPPHQPLFADRPEAELLGYGVPLAWLDDVRQATRENLGRLADRLPGEAAEALLELAAGGKPRRPPRLPAGRRPFDHPDARRRFRVIANLPALERALHFPLAPWVNFLHPEQRQCVEGDYAGPAGVFGSAGTGKSTVALHRAVHLARNHPTARVLLATCSGIQICQLTLRLHALAGAEPSLAQRIQIVCRSSLALRLAPPRHGSVHLATAPVVQELLEEASRTVGGHAFSPRFLLTEWEQVVDAWQLGTWEAYRDFARPGGEPPLPETQRALLWSIFERVQRGLQARNLTTEAALFTAAASAVAGGKPPPFDFAVVDDAEDLSVAHLRFFAALGAHRPNALFFSGNLGERLVQPPLAWESLGVDVRGRSRTLRVNYRASHQICEYTDRLLGPKAAGPDGHRASRTDAVATFNGPPAAIRVLADPAAEIRAVAAWLGEQWDAYVPTGEMAILVRSEGQLHRAKAAAAASGLRYTLQPPLTCGRVWVGTMHAAKGLEFRAVAVMACDDQVIPSPTALADAEDHARWREVDAAERRLLYVACTRARDHLLITGVQPASKLLDDLRGTAHPAAE